MLNLIPVIALIFFVNTSGPGQNYKVERLRDVNSVYVAEFGKTEQAKALRKEIIKELSGSGRVRIVDAAADADAVLNVNIKEGSKPVDQQYQDLEAGGTTVTGYKIVPDTKIVFQLDSKQRRQLWAVKLDYDRFAGSDAKAAREIADRVNREFLKAFERESKGRH